MSTRIISKTAAVIAFLACVGCAPRTSDVAADDSKAYEPVVFRDSVTGCEYLSTGTYHPLTPRMDANGKQVCKARP